MRRVNEEYVSPAKCATQVFDLFIVFFFSSLGLTLFQHNFGWKQYPVHHIVFLDIITRTSKFFATNW